MIDDGCRSLSPTFISLLFFYLCHLLHHEPHARLAVQGAVDDGVARVARHARPAGGGGGVGRRGGLVGRHGVRV